MSKHSIRNSAQIDDVISDCISRVWLVEAAGEIPLEGLQSHLESLGNPSVLFLLIAGSSQDYSSREWWGNLPPKNWHRQWQTQNKVTVSLMLQILTLNWILCDTAKWTIKCVCSHFSQLKASFSFRVFKVVFADLFLHGLHYDRLSYLNMLYKWEFISSTNSLIRKKFFHLCWMRYWLLLL